MPAPAEHSIYALEEKDAEAVSSLESACFSTAFSPEQYRRILHIPPGRGAPFLGLGLFAPARNLRGYVLIGLRRAAREAEVYNLAVHGSCRRLGLGAMLLTRALRAVEVLSIEQVFLEVREGNHPALALYSSLGFEFCNRRRAYYADSGEDALILRLYTAPGHAGQRTIASNHKGKFDENTHGGQLENV
ncbi:MAG: GNAT family N-acetyltransferase [Desulfovibrio sp.]|jgi:ribosomal-protein-alanine N-acetyltransferase|nr:GNAT family N-acetyltransferase [Desulfovibrio sp.]